MKIVKKIRHVAKSTILVSFIIYFSPGKNSTKKVRDIVIRWSFMFDACQMIMTPALLILPLENMRVPLKISKKLIHIMMGYWYNSFDKSM